MIFELLMYKRPRRPMLNMLSVKDKKLNKENTIYNLENIF